MTPESELNREKAEQLIRFQASLLDQVHNAVIVTDLDAKIVLWNQFAETLYQWRAHEVLGKSILDVAVLESDREMVKTFLAERQERGYWEGECRVRRKNGSIFRVHATDAVIRNEKGESVGGVCVSEEITPAQRAETDLLSREQILQKIFDRVPILIAISDGAGKVSFVNRCFVQTFGWTLEEVRTQNIIAELRPDEPAAPKFFEFLQESLKEWATVRMRTKDGSLIDTSWTSVLLKDGTRVGIGLDIPGSIRTVADRGITDRELFASRELVEVLSRRLIEAQEEERRNLSRELHDEIGQVLTTVNLNLEGMRSKIDPTGIGRLEDSLKVVNLAIEQIRNMTLDLRPASLDLLGLDATLRVYLKRQSTRAGLAVDFTSDLGSERFPVPVETVCFRVVQEALTNVFRHARATHCWINVARSAGQIRISIRDDGRGFDPVVAKDRALGGEGFGLLGMFERVQIAGGQMNIDSAPDRGTTITASFPL